MSNHTDNNSYLDMGVANVNDTSNYWLLMGNVINRNDCNIKK